MDHGSAQPDRVSPALTLVMTGHPPSPNRLARCGHWGSRRALTEPWKRQAWAHAKRLMASGAANGFPWKTATLYLLMTGPHMWDADNMLSACKSSIDGVRHAGLIAGDRADQLAVNKIRFLKSSETQTQLTFVKGIEG